MIYFYYLITLCTNINNPNEFIEELNKTDENNYDKLIGYVFILCTSWRGIENSLLEFSNTYKFNIDLTKLPNDYKNIVRTKADNTYTINNLKDKILAKEEFLKLHFE